MQEIYQPSKHSSSNLEPVVQLDRRENDTFLKEKGEEESETKRKTLHTAESHISNSICLPSPLLTGRSNEKPFFSTDTEKRRGKKRRKKNRDAGEKGTVGEERPRNITQSADSGCSRPSIIAADMS